MRTFDMTPLFARTVGFDRLDRLFETALRDAGQSYPPYDIAKTGEDTYRITLAVAGFTAEDLEMSTHEGVLTIKGSAGTAEDGVQYLHRGIARRAFEHRFQLADYVQVQGASLTNGLLTVELVREVPEAMKPRQITIGGAQRPKVVEGKKSEQAAA